jgi:hypothetical protein
MMTSDVQQVPFFNGRSKTARSLAGLLLLQLRASPLHLRYSHVFTPKKKQQQQ